MPKRAKNSNGKSRSSAISVISNANDNISMMSLDSTVTSTTGAIETPYKFTALYLQEKLDESIQKVERRYDEQMNEMTHSALLLKNTLTQEQLNLPVRMEKIAELFTILNSSILEMCPSLKAQKAITPGNIQKQFTPASLNRRRSRSLNRTEKLAAIPESPHSTRSSSVGLQKPRAFVTPTAKYAMATPISCMTTASKYTVQKRPARAMDQSMQLKRVMKAGEEAISTAGSPLFVHGRVPCEPEVYIPLDNGVILNIDTETSSGRLCVPQLDLDTKKKLKIICEKLQRCLEN